eukprot:jgi/Orpsp1_1/1177775/evm.model.c7180000062782.2
MKIFTLSKASVTLATLALTFHSTLAVKKFVSCINEGDFALTFDDGPSLEYTSKILDILDKEQVKATFFVNGMNTCDIKNNEVAANLIRREYQSGHVIASHTYSHPIDGISALSDEKLTFEIETLNNIIYDLVGVKPAFFRPPLGEYTPQNEIVLDALNITANILWNLDSEDWNKQYNPTKQYVDNLKIASPSTNSFISLNHDIQKVTATQNLEIVIPYIRSLGYRFVTMDVCTGLSAYQDGTGPLFASEVNVTTPVDPMSLNLTQSFENGNGNTNTLSLDDEEFFDLEYSGAFSSSTIYNMTFAVGLSFLIFLLSVLF